MMEEKKKSNFKEDLIKLFKDTKQDDKWVEKLKSMVRTHYDI
jgi:hypothetical protein